MEAAVAMKLQERLRKIGWDYKYDLYDPVFENYTCLKPVRKPKISVIVISWRYDPLTLQNFQELEKQRKDVRFELIFVNNGAPEAAFESLKPYVNKWINLKENTGAYLARNVGAVFAEGGILVFLEDDGVPAVNFLISHLQVHKQYKILALRGVYKPFSKHEFANASHYYLANKPYPRHCDLEGNCSYQSTAFYKIGGWDDNIKFGHGGAELGYRLFMKYPDKRLQIYHPDPVIFHDFIGNEKSLEIKKYRQQKSSEYLANKFPDISHFVESWHVFKWRSSLLIPKNNLLYHTVFNIKRLKAKFFANGQNVYSELFRLK